MRGLTGERSGASAQRRRRRSSTRPLVLRTVAYVVCVVADCCSRPLVRAHWQRPRRDALGKGRTRATKTCAPRRQPPHPRKRTDHRTPCCSEEQGQEGQPRSAAVARSQRA
jgi:hypothetical protein